MGRHKPTHWRRTRHTGRGRSQSTTTRSIGRSSSPPPPAAVGGKRTLKNVFSSPLAAGLSLDTSCTRLVELFLGTSPSSTAVRRVKPSPPPTADHKFAALYDGFCSTLRARRARGTTGTLRLQTASRDAAAAVQSGRAAAEVPMQPALKRAKSKPQAGPQKRLRQLSIGGFAGAARQADAADLHNVTVQFCRWVYGQNQSFKVGESQLFRELASSLLKAGAAGFTLPPAQEWARRGKDEKSSLERRELHIPRRQAVASVHLKQTHEHQVHQLKNRVESLVDACGYGATMDGSPRHGVAALNVVLTLPDRTTACIDMLDTGGDRKDQKWWADELLKIVKSPSNPLPAGQLISLTLDGGIKWAFDAIEEAFVDDDGTRDVICQWCSCHTMHLLMQALFDLDGVADTYGKLKQLNQFIRNHNKPRWMLKQIINKGLVREAQTRFGTRYLVIERAIELTPHIQRLVVSQDWADWVNTLAAPDKASAAEARTTALDESFWAQCAKIWELGEPMYTVLRKLDSDDPTVGTIYQLMLELEAHCGAWHDGRHAANGQPGYQASEHTLLSRGNHADTGAGAAEPWNAKEIVAFRWQKMHNAGSGGLLHYAGHALNPAFFSDESARCDDVKGGLEACATKMYGSERAARIWQQYMVYLRHPKDSRIFVDAAGQRHRSCDYHGPGHGLEGREWWEFLPFAQQKAWPDLRVMAMEVLSLTSTESAAERHYSQLNLVQGPGRARLGLKKAGQLTFVQWC